MENKEVIHYLKKTYSARTLIKLLMDELSKCKVENGALKSEIAYLDFLRLEALSKMTESEKEEARIRLQEVEVVKKILKENQKVGANAIKFKKKCKIQFEKIIRLNETIFKLKHHPFQIEG